MDKEYIDSLDFGKVGLHINRTSLAMRRRIQSTIHRKGYRMTPEQLIIVRLLDDSPGITQTAIAKLMNKDKAAITRMLDNLNFQGFISRKPDAKDGRKYLVYLSEKGESLHKDLVPAVENIYTELVSGLTPDEESVITRVLNRIYTIAEERN